MLWMIAVASFFCIFVFTYLLLRTRFPEKEAAELRLQEMVSGIDGRTDDEAEVSRSFVQRLLSPLTGSFAARFPRFAPQALRQRVTEKLAIAGGLGGLEASEYLLLTTIMGFVFPAIIAGLLVMEQVPMNKVLGITLLLGVFGFGLPFFILEHKIRARRQSMQLELPDVLDLITVSVEAGLGFEGALVKLSEKMKGALVEEFSRMLNEMRVGVPRKDALIALGERCNLADVHSFTMSLIQADQLGVSIGNVLRVKSVAIREKRRQYAEELAMKAPVKMLFPLIFFIFPTIFVILLGPAIIKIIATFSKL